MNKQNERGFSLIELIVVVVIVGVIATIAIPYLFRAMNASQNSNIFASLRSAASTQVNFFSQNNRFARLDELNTILGGSLGTASGDDLVKGRFVLTMSPDSNPSDADLADAYTIVATRQVSGSDLPYVATVDESGRVVDNLFSLY